MSDTRKLAGGFITEWEYDRTIEGRNGKTYHLWKCEHREGHTAYQLTHQPANGSGRDFVKPQGSGHFTNLEAALECAKGVNP